MSRHFWIDIKPHNEFRATRAAHNAGVLRPETADKSRKDLNQCLIDARETASETIRELLSKRGRGAVPKAWVEIVIGAPPAYHKPEYDAEWGRARELAWFQDTARWAVRSFPDAFIGYLALHCDETASHVHLGLATTCPTGEPGEYRLNWSKTIENAARLAPNAPKNSGMRAYRLLLESYEHHVGRKYDLVPGNPPEPGKEDEVKVDPVDRTLAWEARALYAEKRARKAEERERVAKAGAAAAIAGRQRILDEAEAAQRNLDALNSAQVRAAVDRALSKARDKGSRER